MATGSRNNKSQQIVSRIPLDVVDELEKLKEEGESTASFIVTSVRGEIKRRQRRKAKEETPES